MLDIKNSFPDDDEALRKSIYSGAIYIIPADAASLSLVDDLRQKLKAGFGVSDLTALHKNIAADDVQNVMASVRDIVKDPDYSVPGISSLLKSLGFDAERTVFDVLRLRCVPHGGYKNPKTVHAYTAHRDTWYANPACQINWWMPLFDVDERQTFRFFPRYFKEPIANSSGGFDYRSWMEQVGFQSKKTHDLSSYPAATESPEDGEASAFSCRAGDIVMFSAAHLHRTCNNDSGRTRFSVDFRTVHTGDLAAGIGAPDPDNASHGDATADYLTAA